MSREKKPLVVQLAAARAPDAHERAGSCRVQQARAGRSWPRFWVTGAGACKAAAGERRARGRAWGAPCANGLVVPRGCWSTIPPRSASPVDRGAQVELAACRQQRASAKAPLSRVRVDRTVLRAESLCFDDYERIMSCSRGDRDEQDVRHPERPAPELGVWYLVLRTRHRSGRCAA